MGKLFAVFLLVSLGILDPNYFIVCRQDIVQQNPLEKAETYLEKLASNYAEGNYQLHKTYSDSLLQISTKHNLTKMQILGLTNQAVFYKNRSERLKAIELYHKALEKCEQIPEDFRTKIIVLVNMGNIYNDIGYHEKAIKYMKNVLQLLDTNENSDRIRAAALVGLANNYLEFNNHQKTIFYAEKAKAIGEKLENEDVIISATNNISDAYIISKNYEKALKINETVAHLSMLEKPTKKRASFLLNNGIANYHLNHLDVSLKNLNECQELSNEKRILETQMYAHEFLAKVYEKKNDYKSSIAEQKQYRYIRELFLKDKKDASNEDLNQELDLKSEIIAEHRQELKGFSKNKIFILSFSACLLLLLSCFLMFNIRRKKRLKEAQIKLQNQYRNLQKDFNNYKREAIKETLIKTKASKKKTLKPYKNSSLNPQKRQEYKSKILAYMTKEKPYLNPEMTQSDLALEIDISSHHFSEVLYYNMEQNFYNFINSYRILEAQNLMKDSKYFDSKILAIAYDSGFKSKSTFNRIFKNHTGITPSEYRNQLEG